MPQFRLFVPWQERSERRIGIPASFAWQRDAFVIAHTSSCRRARAIPQAVRPPPPLARPMSHAVARSADLERLAMSEVVYESLLVDAALDVAFEVRARRARPPRRMRERVKGGGGCERVGRAVETLGRACTKRDARVASAQMHRRAKTGLLPLGAILDASWNSSASRAASATTNGGASGGALAEPPPVDDGAVFGDAPAFARSAACKEPKGNFFCPHCSQKVSVLRFAHHLDKCMQKGRFARAAASNPRGWLAAASPPPPTPPLPSGNGDAAADADANGTTLVPSPTAPPQKAGSPALPAAPRRADVPLPSEAAQARWQCVGNADGRLRIRLKRTAHEY